MSDFDLEEQQEPEQFLEEDSGPPSKEVYKILKEQKKQEELHNKRLKEKHKAVFHHINNINHYVCDHCKHPFQEKDGGHLIYKASGEYAYCNACLKELYPNYKPIHLTTTMSKLDRLSNHADTAYSKGFK